MDGLVTKISYRSFGFASSCFKTESLDRIEFESKTLAFAAKL